MALAMRAYLKKKVEKELTILNWRRKIWRQNKKIESMPEEEKPEEAKKGTCMKIVSTIEKVVEFPFDWIRKLTIPPCEVQHYDKVLVIIWPFFGILTTMMIITKSWPSSPMWALYLVPSSLWALMFYCIKGTVDPKDLESDDEDEKEGGEKDESMKKAERFLLPGDWFILIAIVGMIMGFIWTYYVSGLMIDALTFVGVLSKLSTTYLALTIIAVGNALPDSLLTVALAKKGKAELGITGGYAGQLFGLLVGFGLAMLKKSLTEPETIEFPLFTNAKDNMLDIIVIFTCLICLVTTFIYGLVNKMKFDKGLGLTLALVYLCFILGATVIACIQAY
jgi:Ca2+/Na+ antiporter